MLFQKYTNSVIHYQQRGGIINNTNIPLCMSKLANKRQGEGEKEGGGGVGGGREGRGGEKRWLQNRETKKQKSLLLNSLSFFPYSPFLPHSI